MKKQTNPNDEHCHKRMQEILLSNVIVTCDTEAVESSRLKQAKDLITQCDTWPQTDSFLPWREVNAAQDNMGSIHKSYINLLLVVSLFLFIILCLFRTIIPFLRKCQAFRHKRSQSVPLTCADTQRNTYWVKCYYKRHVTGFSYFAANKLEVISKFKNMIRNLLNSRCYAGYFLFITC